MKLIICNWCFDWKVTEAFEELGYEHNVEIEVEDRLGVFSIADKFFEKDLNVMILQSKKDRNAITLEVDTKSFGQR